MSAMVWGVTSLSQHVGGRSAIVCGFHGARKGFLQPTFRPNPDVASGLPRPFQLCAAPPLLKAFGLLP